MRFRNLLGQPSFDRKTQGTSLFTISNALLRSIKMANRSKFCLLYYSRSCQAAKMSLVLQSGIKPHCASGRFS